MVMVLVERRGAIALVTLNNPAQYNALAGSMVAELKDTFAALEADAAVRAVLLTGAGRGFCSGANLSGDSLLGSASEIGARIKGNLNPLIVSMRSSRLPIVVAVNGPAAGAGVGLALAGDIVLAARSAKFVLSFVRLAAVLDAGCSVSVQRRVGAARARGLALLSESLDAETAERWGLIWGLCEDEELLDRALELAQQLAGRSPLAIAAIKAQLESGWSADLHAALEDEARQQAQAFLSEDLREGVRAFQEKRPANFTGR
jgi:2-(1,2-epoxy-1,2-dihydrophenyl)acetyl-CoA isomerase